MISTPVEFSRDLKRRLKPKYPIFEAFDDAIPLDTNKEMRRVFLRDFEDDVDDIRNERQLRDPRVLVDKLEKLYSNPVLDKFFLRF